MTILCPVCKKSRMPISKSACSRECIKKSLVSGLFPEKSEEAKQKRKIDLMTRRT